MNEHPKCTFTETCIFKRNSKCGILNDMPKKNKEGVCPFRKKHINDVGGKADYIPGKEN